MVYAGFTVYAVEINGRWGDLLGNVGAVALRVLIFVLILALGWLVATWIRRWVSRGLHRIGFDRVVENGGLQRVLGANQASDLAARLVVFAFWIFVLQVGFGIFGPNPVSDLIRSVIAWLPSLFVAVIIVVVATLIAGWVRGLISGALNGLPYGRTVGAVTQVLIIVLGIMAALNQLGVATTVTLPVLIAALATVAGIAIVGVGGGLIKPMQHRWERILNRAETETTLAREKVRSRRDPFTQPAYGGTRTDPAPSAAASDTTAATGPAPPSGTSDDPPR
jgi:hypothetical protein